MNQEQLNDIKLVEQIATLRSENERLRGELRAAQVGAHRLESTIVQQHNEAVVLHAANERANQLIGAQADENERTCNSLRASLASAEKELYLTKVERDAFRTELEHISKNLCGVEVGGDVTHDTVHHFVEGEIEKQSDRADKALNQLASAEQELEWLNSVDGMDWFSHCDYWQATRQAIAAAMAKGTSA
jgi:hypothetical protein